jgi:type I restriction enzyme S subunit
MINMGEIFAHERIGNIEMERVPMNDKEIEQFSVNRGDLLFARQSLVAAGAGKCSLVKSVGEISTFESHLIRIRLDQKLCNPDFYFYYFLSPHGKANVKSLVMQVAAAGIRGSELAKLQVPLPPLPVQQSIAGILSAYDELIENSQRRIKILESMARALYREWFIQFRFPGHEHHQRIASPLGEIPQGWKATTLGEFVSSGSVTLQTGPFGTQLKAAHYADEGTPVINVRNIGFGSLRSEKLEFLAPERAAEHKRHKLQVGDIIFGRKGAVERHLLVSPGEDGWIQGSDCIRLRVECEPLKATFLSIAFREDEHQRWMMNQCSSAATMASLNQDILSRIPLVLPLPLLIAEFDQLAVPILGQSHLLAEQIKNLRRTRDLLLPRLLSGQIEVEAA